MQQVDLFWALGDTYKGVREVNPFSGLHSGLYAVLALRRLSIVWKRLKVVHGFQPRAGLAEWCEER